MLAPSVGLLAAVAAAGPPWALVCLRRCACSALFGMRAAPSRWCSGPWPSSALRLNRSRRPRLRSWRRPLGAKACAPAAGFRCAPLCPCCAVSRGSGGGRAVRQAPAIPFFSSGGGWLLPAHSAAVAPFAGLAAGSQGRGACSSRPTGRPLRAPPLQPRPPVLAPGRGYFVFAAAGIDIAPALTRGAVSCGALYCHSARPPMRLSYARNLKCG